MVTATCLIGEATLVAMGREWARIRDGLRRRLKYSLVRGEPGVVLRELGVAGEPLLLGDFEGSVAIEVVAGEVGDGAYDFSDIDFRPGDTVVDLGAHLGVVSIFLAKRYPFIQVLAYEPMPRVFELLERNIKRNRVHNVKAFNLAVTSDGSDLELVSHLLSNSGGATSNFFSLDLPDHERIVVPSVTLDQIVEEHHIERGPLLKIDIEGGEYEVLKSATSLKRFENIRGEFHENAFLLSQGYSMRELESYCEGVIGDGRVHYTKCYMADL
jgi:FkbM family methyltransferase